MYINEMKAIWNGQVLAENDVTTVVDGYHYFPSGSVKMKFLVDSEKHTFCSWKGTASYYTLDVDGLRNVDAAWYYPEPSAAAENIRGKIAFWKGVQIKT